MANEKICINSHGKVVISLNITKKNNIEFFFVIRQMNFSEFFLDSLRFFVQKIFPRFIFNFQKNKVNFFVTENLKSDLIHFCRILGLRILVKDLEKRLKCVFWS